MNLKLELLWKFKADRQHYARFWKRVALVEGCLREGERELQLAEDLGSDQILEF